VLRLKQEVEALRVAAPLLSDGGADDDRPGPRLQRAVNETPQPQDRSEKGWP
jgi:hypothetical protein